MSKKTAIILGNYKDEAERHLDECLASLRAQDYAGEIKIYIYDNETSERSFAYIAAHAPEAVIIRNATNDGFAKGNNDGMKLALRNGADYIILFNTDMVTDRACVRKMIEALEKIQADAARTGEAPAGAVQARLMLHPETEKVNSLGNVTHFLGFGYCLGYNEVYTPGQAPLPAGPERFENIAYPAGAAVLFAREALERAGLFDEEFWMYNEDQDLGWRLWLAGYRCVLAPDAVAYHKYQFSKSIAKYYWMDRNRLIVILKNYRWSTLFLILPALIIMEFGLLLFAAKGGWLKEKTDVYRYFLNLKHWRYIMRRRRETQALRKAKDGDIITMFTGRIWYQEIDDWKLRLANPAFAAYWRFVLKIISVLKI